MLTLKDIQTSQFQTASGFCTSSQDFLELVNDAVTELLKRGDWPGTIQPIRVCVRDGCVTWPRYVGQIRKLNHCRGNAPVHNVWYQFLEHDHSEGRNAIYGWHAWRGDNARMNAIGRAPTYNDIYGVNCTVRLYPMSPTDVGQVVTIFGTDNNGQPLQTYNPDGSIDQGIQITLALPFGSSSVFVSSIDRVVKPITQGKVNMFAYDAVQDAMLDLAAYDASETNPDYLRYSVEGLKGSPTPFVGQPCASNCLQSVVALVKLKPIPVAVSSDLVIIDDRRALLNAIRALKAEDSNNPTTAIPFWKAAIEGLNRNLENESPDDQMAVSNNILGSQNRTWRNRCF